MGPMTRLLIGVLLVAQTACTVGYRRAMYNTTVTRDDGRSVKVTGSSDIVNVMLTADFKYFRLSTPFEGSSTEWTFESDEGGRDSDEFVRERRFLRLDAPIVSVFRPEVGWGVWYPGALKKRKSLELWANVEGSFAEDGHRWADLGIMYYHYNSVGMRIYGGIGSEAFRASTPTPGSFARIWDERAVHWGVGIEFTLTAGEYFWELLEYFAGVDRRHQKRIKRNRY